MTSFVEPYAKVQTGWITYDILFEDSKIAEVNGWKFADQLVGMLNGAYNLGRASTIFNPMDNEAA